MILSASNNTLNRIAKELNKNGVTTLMTTSNKEPYLIIKDEYKTKVNLAVQMDKQRHNSTIKILEFK